MAECACIYNSGDGEISHRLSQRVVRARKDYKCCECRNLITKGNMYETYSLASDGEIFTFRTCLTCVEIRSHFMCSWCFEGLYEDILGEYYDDIPVCCMDGLSPEAAELMEEKVLSRQR